MIKSHTTPALALIASVALPALSWAGAPEKAKSAPAPVEKINSSAITGDIGVSVYTTMYSRGSILFKQNPTILPYLDLAAVVYEGDGFLNKAVLGLNITEYYGHVKGNDGTKSNAHWYENDLIPSLALTFGKVTITEGYHNYTTPNSTDVNKTFEGLNSSISFDDGDLLGAFALHPSFTYMQRTNAHGQYFEGAVAPGTSLGDLALTLPVTVGIGEQNFYGPKDGYAYFSVGLNAAYTLPVSKTYGVWKLLAGVTYYSKDVGVTEQGPFKDQVKSNDVSANVGLVINF